MNIKDISFVLQKGVFCEIHIRGIEGHVVVEDDFSEVYRKIKEIPPRVNNTGEGVSVNRPGFPGECFICEPRQPGGCKSGCGRI
ncbi:hypothetical protein [Escherichia coli]|uniref:hypothetical protein n=1 Tax=Escherichia coli TaxID=562 RepID=UPI00311B3508